MAVGERERGKRGQTLALGDQGGATLSALIKEVEVTKISFANFDPGAHSRPKHTRLRDRRC